VAVGIKSAQPVAGFFNLAGVLAGNEVAAGRFASFTCACICPPNQTAESLMQVQGKCSWAPSFLYLPTSHSIPNHTA
jgi:hypothetical protein